MKIIHRSTFKVLAALVIVAALVLGVFSTSQAYGIPIISIKTVVSDVSVTITGVNFPADQTFTVRMGAFGTLGIGGVVVGTKEPASGSSFTATYTIPASLVGHGCRCWTHRITRWAGSARGLILSTARST